MTAPRLGVIVPCRDEARVIERKLANLVRLRWPPGEHRLAIIDDGSKDRTAELARLGVDARFGPGIEGCRVEARVFENGESPGKSGAVRAGCASLADEVDLFVVTDADVVLTDGALVELARAFTQDERLLLACGAQEFVHDFERFVPTNHPFDGLTRLVRSIESRCGKLFSIHGQLMAWRVSAGLLPAPGRPADDLDLMFAARAAGGRVRLIQGAGFFEEKMECDAQAVRRARAYFEALRDRERPLGEGWVDRLQWAFYRRVPGAVPEVVLPIRRALEGLPLGRRLVRMLEIMRTAARAESLEPLSDRWEMQRS